MGLKKRTEEKEIRELKIGRTTGKEKERERRKMVKEERGREEARKEK